MENDETMIPDKDVSVFKTPKGINDVYFNRQVRRSQESRNNR